MFHLVRLTVLFLRVVDGQGWGWMEMGIDEHFLLLGRSFRWLINQEIGIEVGLGTRGKVGIHVNVVG